MEMVWFLTYHAQGHSYQDVYFMRQFFNHRLPLLGLVVGLMFVFNIEGEGGTIAQDSFTLRILALEGKVDLRRAMKEQTSINRSTLPVSIVVRVHDQLFPGDTVITGRDGRVVLGMTDGSQVIIAPKSTVEIDKVTQSPRNLINLIKGKTRIQIEKLGGAPNPYRVNTPTTVIAVRGTIFDVLVDNDQTEVFLHEGEVAVTNRRLPDQPLLLLAGRFTRVRSTLPPASAAIFARGRNDRTFRLKSIQPSLPNGQTTQRPGSSRTPNGESRSPRVDQVPNRRGGAGSGLPSPRSRPGGGRP
jgi:hypothetical protein